MDAAVTPRCRGTATLNDRSSRYHRISSCFSFEGSCKGRRNEVRDEAKRKVEFTRQAFPPRKFLIHPDSGFVSVTPSGEFHCDGPLQRGERLIVCRLNLDRGCVAKELVRASLGVCPLVMTECIIYEKKDAEQSSTGCWGHSGE